VLDVTGPLAGTFLHEIDHLDGILFIDHLAFHDRERAEALIAAGALNDIPQPYSYGHQGR
jgi:peptide deformylase